MFKQGDKVKLTKRGIIFGSMANGGDVGVVKSEQHTIKGDEYVYVDWGNNFAGDWWVCLLEKINGDEIEEGCHGGNANERRGQMKNSINISVEEYDSLLDSEAFLQCLKEKGIKYWDGFDDAKKAYLSNPGVKIRAKRKAADKKAKELSDKLVGIFSENAEFSSEMKNNVVSVIEDALYWALEHEGESVI